MLAGPMRPCACLSLKFLVLAWEGLQTLSLLAAILELSIQNLHQWQDSAYASQVREPNIVLHDAACYK